MNESITTDTVIGSIDVARAAIKLALTRDREEETKLKTLFNNSGIKSCAVDFGGDYSQIFTKIIERAVVAAKRENIIVDKHSEIGAVAGAAHEALQMITPKATGLSVGGKIGIARYHDHLIVCIFAGIGLLHLNEISLGLGHRAL